MVDSLTKLRILSQAEAVLLRLRLRRMAIQVTLLAVGLLLLLVTVAMVNLAAYQYFVERVRPIPVSVAPGVDQRCPGRAADRRRPEGG